MTAPKEGEVTDAECEHCGHIFDTVDERRTHEAKSEYEGTVCPCGDPCGAALSSEVTS
jgi:hypothetical protein